MSTTESFTALCTDFYVNQNIALKMDLPTARETVLDLFDRIRKSVPGMDGFRRFEDELALESDAAEAQYRWLALRQTSIRSGWVNPESLEEAYRLHRLVLDVSPFFLSISPIDVEFIELVFGFDLEGRTNRSEVVFDTLLADSPLRNLFDDDSEIVLDAHPFLGITLSRSCKTQAFFEMRTRTRPGEISTGQYDNEPISVYLTVRRHGPFHSIEDFNEAFGGLAGHIERLAEERVIPQIIVPLREALVSRPE